MRLAWWFISFNLKFYHKEAQNRRPIPLINVDAKIISEALALRFKKIIHTIIAHNVQTAYVKALLGMLARLPWGRRDMLGSMDGKHGGVYVEYVSPMVYCYWIKVFITA